MHHQGRASNSDAKIWLCQWRLGARWVGHETQGFSTNVTRIQAAPFPGHLLGSPLPGLGRGLRALLRLEARDSGFENQGVTW